MFEGHIEADDPVEHGLLVKFAARPLADLGKVRRRLAKILSFWPIPLGILPVTSGTESMKIAFCPFFLCMQRLSWDCQKPS